MLAAGSQEGLGPRQESAQLREGVVVRLAGMQGEEAAGPGQQRQGRVPVKRGPLWFRARKRQAWGKEPP